jgi:hypothetical protein
MDLRVSKKDACPGSAKIRIKVLSKISPEQ